MVALLHLFYLQKENRPFAFIDIMAFLVLEMLLRLEIDRMPQVFPLFEDMDNNGRSPAAGVFDGFVFVHALAVPGKMDRGNLDFVRGQPGGDLIGAVSFQRHSEDAADYGGGFFIHQPVFPLLVPQVAIDHCAGQVLAAHALGLEHRTNFAACVSGIKFVHDVPCVGEKDAGPKV